ncbi:recombinase family protein [Methylobacterium sp. CM6247]
MRSEKVSGDNRDGRSELPTVLEFLRPGNEPMVTCLHRLGRDTRNVLNLIHEAEQRGAFVIMLAPYLNAGRNEPQ